MQRHALLGVGGKATAVKLPAIGVDGNGLTASGWCEQEVGTGATAHPFTFTKGNLLLQLPAHHLVVPPQAEQIALTTLDDVALEGHGDPTGRPFAFAQLLNEAEFEFTFGEGVNGDIR